MPLAAEGEGSIVIGHCFSRMGSQDELGPILRWPDAGTSARSLLCQRWGAYFAVLGDRSTGRWQVLSDPSGLLPVFRLLTSSHAILSSDPALLGAASGEKLEVSWTAVLHHLMQPDLRQRATCLAGVDEMPPGTMLDPCDSSHPEKVLWRPPDHFPSGESHTFAAWRDELRAVAIDVMATWQKELGRVAVAVSGGVDSSFVCGALAAGGSDFACITLATSEAGGDERHFARLLAGHLGRPIAELTYDPATLAPESMASRGLPRPSRRTFVAAVDAMLARGADELGATVVLDGNAGDNLFCYLHSAVPVADRFRSEGVALGTISTLLDMCRVTGCDIATMARATLRRLGADSEGFPGNRDTRLLNCSAHGYASSSRPLTCPWMDPVHGRHKGKRDHVELIMRALHHNNAITSRYPRLSPLMSQPLLETCLRVPTWIWPNGGVNRALARAAFAAELPGELLSRTAKPGPDSFVHETFARNRIRLHARLREGLLAGNGLLDVAQLDLAFEAGAAHDWGIIRRIFELVEAENWARSWQG
jgi:asparagine synthase (glutamine-hydrolysing)